MAVLLLYTQVHITYRKGPPHLIGSIDIAKREKSRVSLKRAAERLAKTVMDACLILIIVLRQKLRNSKRRQMYYCMFCAIAQLSSRLDLLLYIIEERSSIGKSEEDIIP